MSKNEEMGEIGILMLKHGGSIEVSFETMRHLMDKKDTPDAIQTECVYFDTLDGVDVVLELGAIAGGIYSTPQSRIRRFERMRVTREAQEEVATEGMRSTPPPGGVRLHEN